MARPDLLLATPISAPLRAALAERFTLHEGDPPPGVRAVVGGGMAKIDAALLARLPALEIVAIHGVGHDRVDLDALDARGIRITTTAGVLTEDVADQAIALMLAVQRRIAANDALVRAGGWTAPLGRRASGCRIGIFGLGRIGHAIALRAAPFARELLYGARAEKPVPWRFVPDIAVLAEASDVLILAATGGPGTQRIVDAAVLDRLGPGGVLINIARGSLVDQDALVAALAAGRIAGAGLDVFAEEPYVPQALRAMDQVVLAPHQGSATEEARTAMRDLVLANLDAHFAGRPLVTPLRRERRAVSHDVPPRR
ncbi:2-hydroxyacid dehydrogenase [Sphingomonas sp. NPDC092331]|jgi:lactate dehydrogenase-like 2-hydroxyacid dehydrogenase|uniref:2-hydroxyacid dehydrogenase n=1 Tax=unclassified Sphingomonas TaxID=196159 RepID=UPI0031F579BC